MGQEQDAYEFYQVLFGEVNRSLVEGERRHFVGKLELTDACSNCGGKTVHVETFDSLSMSIKHIDTLQKAIDSHFAPEVIRRYSCRRCRKNVDIMRSVKLQQIPKHLVLHFKRFSSVHVGKKDTCRVSMKEELRLQNYVRPDLMEILEHKADLFAAVIHTGRSTNSGHYYSVIRNGLNWFKVDDLKVSAITRNYAMDLAADAYLLFFTTRPRPYIN